MTRPLALVICAAWILLSPVASAKPKVALTQIEGDASGDIREAVLEAIEGDELSLISGKVVNRAVNKLGDLGDLTDRDFKKLASELEADAIIVGTLEKVSGSKRLKFRLFVDKKPAKGFTVSFKNARSEKFRTLLHDKMLDKLGVSASDGAEPEDSSAKQRPPREDDEDPLATKKGRKSGKKSKAGDDEEAQADVAEHEPAAKRSKRDKLAEEDGGRARPQDEGEARPDSSSEEEREPGSDEDGDAPRRSRGKKAALADDEDDEDEDEDLEVRASAAAAPPHAANRAAIRVNLGASLVQRSLRFNARSFQQQPNDVSLTPVAGARLEAEVYPLALSNPTGLAAGFGIAAEYDRTLKLNIRKTNPSVTAPAKQGSYSIGLRYRLAFGKTETSPTLTLGAGYGRRLFSVDVTGVMDTDARGEIKRDTPESELTVIDPGLLFRIPLTRMVAFSLGGRGMIVLDGGPILKGTSYGQAKVYGAQGVAAVEAVFGRRIALRVSGEFVQIGYSFTGVGELSNNLDGDPASKDVGGLADRSIGGSLTLAVLY